MIQILTFLMCLYGMAFGQNVIPVKWDLKLHAQSTSAPKINFQSSGIQTTTQVDGELESYGGFNYLYNQFKTQKTDIRLGVSQEAESFMSWLRDCYGFSIITKENALMRIGLHQIFSSKSDQEVDHVLDELKSKLSTTEKVKFVSLLGGQFLKGYDHSRADGPNDKGIVSLRTMINASQTGSKAGVCRDMSQAMAESLTKLGLKQTYVASYQSAGSGHAVVLAQDPDDATKTYNINYDYLTSTQSASSTAHLKMDSYIPDVGTAIRIYSANGKPLTILPTSLGNLLKEIAGEDISESQALAQSDSQHAKVELSRNDKFHVAAGVGTTPQGDEVKAISAGYQNLSQTYPVRLNVVLYQNERETDYLGTMKTQGVTVSGSMGMDKKFARKELSSGVLTVSGFYQVKSEFQASQTDFSGSTKNYDISSTYQTSMQGGVRGEFVSSDEKTKISSVVKLQTRLDFADVRDGRSVGLSAPAISHKTAITRELKPNHSVNASLTTVSSKAFGTQARQELGYNFVKEDKAIGVRIGHEGQIAGSAPAFIPGARSRIYSDVVVSKNNRYTVSAGGQCTKDTKDCGMRASASIKLGPKRK